MTGTSTGTTNLAGGVYVSSDTIDIVRDAIAAGRDPLGVGTSMASALTGHHAESTVEAAMTRLNREQAHRIETDLRDHPPGPEASLDVVGVDLLLGMGLDPLTVGWLAGLDTSLFIYDKEEMDNVVSFNGEEYGAEIKISHHVWWLVTGRLLVKGLPNTVLTAAVGRPLRDLISHPVLDQHNLTITRAILAVRPDGNACLYCKRSNLNGSAVTRDGRKVSCEVAPYDSVTMHDLLAARHRWTRS